MMKDPTRRPRHCSVKNCQKAIEPGDQVVIGDQAFCKSCAVDYFKDLVGADTRDD